MMHDYSEFDTLKYVIEISLLTDNGIDSMAQFVNRTDELALPRSFTLRIV